MPTTHQIERRGQYPSDWRSVSRRVKTIARWRCVRCGHVHDVNTGHVLTVHHLDGDPTNNRWWNLAALCQRCHLSVQARVVMDRPYVMFDHSEWMKPYVGGFYAYKYLGLELTRRDIEKNLEWFASLERRMIRE